MTGFPSGNQNWNIQRMKGIHHKIAQWHLAGINNLEIADALGVSHEMVSATLNSDIAKERLALVTERRYMSMEDIRKEIKEAAINAVEVLASMVDPDEELRFPPHLRLKAAQDVLDRAGLGAPRKIEGRVLHGIATNEDIEMLKERLRKQDNQRALSNGLKSGIIVDTEVEMVEPQKEVSNA